MKKINHIIFALIALASFLAVGCKKSGITLPPAQAHFIGETNQAYAIEIDPAPVYTVTVGTTDVSAEDRTISYTITSPTGAAAGAQYTIAGTSGSVVIPAGQTTAVIEVQGIYSAYSAGRKDVLIFKLQTPGVEVAEFQNTVNLALRGPCFEGDIVLDELLGDYTNTVEVFNGGAPYGPYTTSISSVTSTGPTTANIVIKNIWNNGWGPIGFTLDWTNPASPTVTVISQNVIVGSDAGDISSGYAGETIAVKPLAGQTGTYSYCKNTLTLKMNLGVSDLGFFNVLYQVKMAR